MCTMEAYIATRVLQGYTQYQSDKSKANYINQQAETKGARLRNEAIYTDNAFIRKQEAEEDKAAFQKEKVSTQKLNVEGAAKVAFFEKGLGGNLYNTVLGDISRQAGKQFNTIDQNYENKLRAIGYDRLSYNRRYTNQILSLPRAYKPSFMTYALSTAVDIGGVYMANQAPKTPSSMEYQTIDSSLGSS